MSVKTFSSVEEYDEHFNVKFIGELDGIKIYLADFGYAPNSFGREDRFTFHGHKFTADLWSKLVDEFQRLRKPEGRDKLLLDKYQLDSLLELQLLEVQASEVTVQCDRCLGKGKCELVFSVEDPCSKCRGSGFIDP